jgi:hypothetical protein
MDLTQLPIASELFAQWQRARGAREQPATRPFSRSWEELLDDAHLLTATERSEAERDIAALAKDGLVVITPVRYKQHLIARIAIPLDAEASWREAFGFVPLSDEEARQIREFPWVPELAFLSETRLLVPISDLRQLNDYLKTKSSTAPIIPIKERSLQIFGDEKRLDTLQTSTLFTRSDRLNLERDLRCEIIGVPLAWQRGPREASHQPLIVLENAATWHTYARWNMERKLFSAVIYGDGNRFVDGIRYLPNILAELAQKGDTDIPVCPPSFPSTNRQILYFGDLDPQGLLIPQEASNRAQAKGLPAIEPHLWSYRHLLKIGTGQPWEGAPADPTLYDWLQDCAPATRELFSKNQRLAQEHISWVFLQNCR